MTVGEIGITVVSGVLRESTVLDGRDSSLTGRRSRERSRGVAVLGPTPRATVSVDNESPGNDVTEDRRTGVRR